MHPHKIGGDVAGARLLIFMRVTLVEIGGDLAVLKNRPDASLESDIG